MKCKVPAPFLLLKKTISWKNWKKTISKETIISDKGFDFEYAGFNNRVWKMILIPMNLFQDSEASSLISGCSVFLSFIYSFTLKTASAVFEFLIIDSTGTKTKSTAILIKVIM
ncbi:unnamed protein product [Rhizophagus irregularis]|nr:unnamed protein product [Rhizophagus irregularis]CAB5358080.1 unnamed protein product [Rhizophagus irregularis]